MTPNARFNELIKDITPSATTNSRSSSAHNKLRDGLLKDEDYKDDIITTFLGGSYRRNTAIRPVTKDGDTERPDVDMYVVVKGSTWSTSPDDLIENLYTALNRNRTALNITKLKRNRCSIAVSTDKADMDVSPLLDRQDDGYFRIGNRLKGEWYKTDPIEHNEWSARENKDRDGRFNPMVKLIKWTRREFPTQHKHPKGIGLEAHIAEHMDDTETHYGQLVHDFFDEIVTTYESNRSWEGCPSLDDPAVSGGNLLGGVSDEAFNAFYDKCEKMRDTARKALDEDDQEKATKLWRQIFGARFPAPPTQKSVASIGLKTTAAMSPLAFPAQASTPPNKPAHFA